MTATVPTLDELIEGATSPSTMLTASYVSAWIVRHTWAPAWARDAIAVALVLAPVAGVVLWARSAGVSLERGRCRARTSDGRRCRRESEGIGADLCWQHQDLAEVELVDERTD